MVSKAVLKEPWTSPRGKTYPAGSTFELLQRDTTTQMLWFTFNIPGQSRGFVKFSTNIFHRLTEEEEALKASRKKEIEKFLEKTKSPFL